MEGWTAAGLQYRDYELPKKREKRRDGKGREGRRWVEGDKDTQIQTEKRENKRREIDSFYS